MGFFKAKSPASGAEEVKPLTMERVIAALQELEIKYLRSDRGHAITLWDRFRIMYALDDKFLVMIVRADAMVPAEWGDRALRAVNQWNNKTKLLKAYIDSPDEDGRLPVMAELYASAGCGLTDAQLLELVRTGTIVGGKFVDWLYDDGGLL